LHIVESSDKVTKLNMAITKGAKKAIRNSEKKAVFNLRRKRAVQTVEKELLKLLEENKVKEAKELLSVAYKKIDKAVKMGTMKENTGSRRKAKYSRMVKNAEGK
jgi:small subunit ribosomal protein S20